MTLIEILALALAAAVAWLFWDSLKARETANAAMREACRRDGLLFLDDTVALQSLRPWRNPEGRVQLRRVFAFEYSDTGSDRRRGRLTMLGEFAETLELEVDPVLDDSTGPW